MQSLPVFLLRCTRPAPGIPHGLFSQGVPGQVCTLENKGLGELGRPDELYNCPLLVRTHIT